MESSLGVFVAAAICALLAFGAISGVRMARRTGRAVMFFQWPRVEAIRNNEPRKFRFIVAVDIVAGALLTLVSVMLFGSAVLGAFRSLTG